MMPAERGARFGCPGANERRKEPDLREALLLLGGLVLLFAGGTGVLRIDIVPLLALGALGTTALFRLRYGYGWRRLFLDGVLPLLGRTGSAMGVLLFVGPLVAAWTLAGTIPTLMWLGLASLSAAVFLPAAFLLCAAASLITGTSWGTAGTFGVALAGVAQALGVPLPAAAGAIIGGAYFGDKLSPISDTTLLAAAVAEVDVADHIRSMLWTTLPAALLSLVVYAVASSGAAGGDAEHARAIRSALEEAFRLHPVLLLPPLLLLVLAWRRVPVLLALAAAVAAALPFAFLQGYGPSDILRAMIFGTGNLPGLPAVQGLPEQGGAFLLGRVVAVVCVAYVFVGQFQVGGVFRLLGDALKERFIQRGISRVPANEDEESEKASRPLRADASAAKGRFVLSVSLVGLATALGTGNTYLCSILPGGMFKELADDLGVRRHVLSRTLEDSGTVVAPLVPWSAAAVYLSALLGVETVDYLPWAVLCWAGFPAAWCIGFSGILDRT